MSQVFSMLAGIFRIKEIILSKEDANGSIVTVGVIESPKLLVLKSQMSFTIGKMPSLKNDSVDVSENLANHLSL